ncbi:MAG: rRNA maturation RNase YbeY [Saccharofermentanales bacterium]|jgi:probable rRNA maturation factor
MNKSELSLELFFSDFCFEDESISVKQSSGSDKLSDPDLWQISESESVLFSKLQLDQPELLSNLLLELGKVILNMEGNIEQFLSEQELSARIDVELLSSQSMRQINASTRGIDEITDVLSFPNFNFSIIHESHQTTKCETANFDFTIEPYAWLDPTAEFGTISLGEILICPLKAQKQAVELGHSLIRELCFLYMHGLLHLCGYDHHTEADAAQMFALQKNILPELEKLITINFDFKEKTEE